MSIPVDRQSVAVIMNAVGGCSAAFVFELVDAPSVTYDLAFVVGVVLVGSILATDIFECSRIGMLHRFAIVSYFSVGNGVSVFHFVNT